MKTARAAGKPRNGKSSRETENGVTTESSRKAKGGGKAEAMIEETGERSGMKKASEPTKTTEAAKAAEAAEEAETWNAINPAKSADPAEPIKPAKSAGIEAATEVAAALIWDKDRFLICQRPENKARGLLWEFVGGKTEAGETLRQALIRECMEELGAAVEPGEVFMETVHTYPDLTVRLALFNAEITDGEIVLLEHKAMRWISPAEIPQYDFCPADEEILKKLMTDFGMKKDEQAFAEKDRQVLEEKNR